jgi:hypothetical protein
MPSISGILAPTTQRETVPIAEPVEGQGTELANDGSSPEPRVPKTRRAKKATGPADKLEGRRLYLSDQVHFRLMMLAHHRGKNLSEMAEEVLDKNLPRYEVNRVG